MRLDSRLRYVRRTLIRLIYLQAISPRMARWSIMRLYRDSIAFRWTANTFIFGVVISLLIFGIQTYQDSKNKEFFKEEFLKTQELCAKNLEACEDKDTQKKLRKYEFLVDDFYDRAIRATKGGHYNEARYFYDQIAAIDSKYTENSTFWYEYARILEIQSEYGDDLIAFENAAKAIEIAIELNNKDLDFYDEAAYIYYELSILKQDSNYFQKSISMHDKILSIDPTNINALVGKIYLYSNYGDDEKLKKSLDFAMKLYPGNIRVLYPYAFYLATREKNYQECYILLGKIIGLPEEDFPGYDKYIIANILHSVCIKEVGVLRNNQTMVDNACQNMIKIQEEVDINKLHYNTEERNQADINITIEPRLDCNGYAIIKNIEFAKQVPNMGLCSDPFDKDISIDKCLV